MKVTRLEAGDRDRWTELWRAYLAFYDTEMPEEIYDHTIIAPTVSLSRNVLWRGLDGLIDGIVNLAGAIWPDWWWTSRQLPDSRTNRLVAASTAPPINSSHSTVAASP